MFAGKGNPGQRDLLALARDHSISGAEEIINPKNGDWLWVPKMSLVDCANREDWRRILCEMNQPTGPVPQFTVLIQDASDLRRLQLAFATQNTIFE